MVLEPFDVTDFAALVIGRQSQRLGYQTAVCFIHAMRIDYPMGSARVLMLKKPYLIGPGFAFFGRCYGFTGVGDTGKSQGPKEKDGREN